MTVEMTPEELEAVLIALKEHARRLQGDGQPPLSTERLVAKLEVAERSLRYGPRPAASNG